MSWNDFNNAEDQQEFDLIPNGTLAKVRMSIKPGGFDDPQMGWTGGYATFNPTTGAVYLSCEFVVIGGAYDKRKVWRLIGLHSSKGPDWGNMGRSFIKGILNSARNLDPIDNSPQAQQARCINSFAELDGVEFIAKIGKERDSQGDPKNTISIAITKEHADYANLMAGLEINPAQSPVTSSSSTGGYAMPQHTAGQYQTSPMQTQRQSQAQTPNTQSASTTASSSGRPTWAQ
ncbi:hypothetical protein [Teredinibacter sp. KSP-S5-2]|uniref:hypothetical protein n=1 Tax=Teredinibacter sp. KSP-S5-2 TaxID=3034506 RepID=UPI002934CE24|nr:hypothetical protein [Teredinibacter sp. KSP-S5-2]WNO10398.1 hypothetical protein P5V12_04365 [Teredinibacter sp. KSP-S5-2]